MKRTRWLARTARVAGLLAGLLAPLPLAAVVDTQIDTFESGAAMLMTALPAPGWLQPVLDTLVRV